MARLKTKAGTLLTREVVEAMADEAERGYDLSTWKRVTVQRGRPSLEAGVSPRITYRVPATTYQRAKQKAETEGRTVSAIAREALERYVTE